MNPTRPSYTSSTTPSGSTIRPRPRRRESALDGSSAHPRGGEGSSSSRLGSPTPSRTPSRPVSPLPSNGLPQPARSHGQRHSRSSVHGSPANERYTRQNPTSKTSSGSGLWSNSWTALQGLASSVLGSDPLEGPKDDSGSINRAPRRQREHTSEHRRAESTGLPSEWGPTPSAKVADYVGTGSPEARDALMRAERRKALLSANGHGLPDYSGRYKRRSSDDRGPSSSVPPLDHDRDEEGEALVYIHHVKPQDTLAGVMIQYHCSAAAFRKANRFWPNDSIQTRKTVVLPVEACGVKGTPVATQTSTDVDLLLDEPGIEPIMADVKTGWNNSVDTTSTVRKAERRLSPSLTFQDPRDDPSWKHESWVQIDGHQEPVEIARLPRRRLGFFPRSRRKSISFSDLDTPSASLDLVRSRQSSPRERKDRSGSSSHFAQKLHGPGGVGPLRSDVSSPGPAQDNFNRYLAPHLPSVAPRDSFDGGSGTSTPFTGLDHVGSTIESWVRKMATRAATAVEHPTGNQSLGFGGAGDLIELSDGLDGLEDTGRARQTSGIEDIERGLRDRNPVRGRLTGPPLQKKGD